MATNEYQTFGDSGTDGVNKLSLTNYIADQDRVYGNGFTTKVVRSQLHNKALQQTSKMSAALAQFLVINNISALDTDSVTTISNNIVSAVGNSTAAATHAATSKATPVDADEIGIADSTTSFSLKKLTWANLKATLKTYFDNIYMNISYLANISYKATPISITAWSYTGTTTTTITLTVASHTFVVNDFISVNGLTTSTAVSTANNYIIPNGVYQVTAITGTTIQYTITTPSALTLTPTVSSATVIGQTAVNGVVGGLGVGQTPVDLTTQRAIGTTYYNTSGKPISVTVWVVSTSNSTNVSLLINGVTSILVGGSVTSLNMAISSQIIPNGSSYQISVSNATLVGWKELR